MPIPSDYKELLNALNRHRVKYLIVGAYAVICYTEPRYTKDLDIWIAPGKENAARIYKALREFGAPLKGISVEDFTKENLVYQIGIAPVRVDILMGLTGIKFDFAWRRRKPVVFEGVKCKVIGIKDLMKLKKKSKRPMDLVDLENLKLRNKIRKK